MRPYPCRQRFCASRHKRAGEKLTNEFDGETHDYTHKGGVVHTEILLPSHAPDAFSDWAVLWNAVEKIEKAKNAQLAREIEIALPRELTREQGGVRSFATGRWSSTDTPS